MAINRKVGCDCGKIFSVPDSGSDLPPHKTKQGETCTEKKARYDLGSTNHPYGEIKE